MKRKIMIYVLSILCIFIVSCDSTGIKENNEGRKEESELENTEFVNSEEELINALNNYYSVTINDNITSNNELIIEEEFFKTDTAEENNVVNIGIRINLFSKDENNNIINNYVLEAPSLTIQSENTIIKGGTFIGDIYIEAKGFEIDNTKVKGNLYFKDEETKNTFVKSNTASVQGQIRVEGDES